MAFCPLGVLIPDTQILVVTVGHLPDLGMMLTNVLGTRQLGAPHRTFKCVLEQRYMDSRGVVLRQHEDCVGQSVSDSVHLSVSQCVSTSVSQSRCLTCCSSLPRLSIMHSTRSRLTLVTHSYSPRPSPAEPGRGGAGCVKTPVPRAIRSSKISALEKPA